MGGGRRPPAEAVLAGGRALDDLGFQGLGHVWLAHAVAYVEGPVGAEREYRAALPCFRALNEPGRVAETLTNIACTLIEQGRASEVKGLLDEALGQTMRGLALCALSAAAIGAQVGAQDEVVRAATLLGAVQRMLDRGLTWATPIERADHDAVVEQVQAALDAATWRAASQRGRGMGMDEVVALALRGD